MGMSILYKPPHRIQDILSRRLRARVRVVVSEHDNVRMGIVMSCPPIRSIAYFFRQPQTNPKDIDIRFVRHPRIHGVDCFVRHS